MSFITKIPFILLYFFSTLHEGKIYIFQFFINNTRETGYGPPPPPLLAGAYKRWGTVQRGEKNVETL